ncbi:MAG TPA: permease-like cell division protein FtsX [Paludibacteraceae bacterium]|nr:permease-like cell division protein FtsX [Paludibacteraceae bacterium]HQB68491.1 permease-like cell division protein FtsX [Paludibacteraceae bacterium]HRS66992.1 permease-like cell division protein FtsX [Paludibacteraceae bacterium]
MAYNSPKQRKDSFFNLHFTSIISISLVLFMVGLITFLFLLTKEITTFTKEHITLSIVLKESTSENDITRLQNYLTATEFTKRHEYISKEAALAEHVKGLGEDPTELLGFNPLRASIEVYLNAEYAQTDSIAQIEKKLQVFNSVEEVIYQKDMIQMLNENVSRVSIVLSSIAIILLFISIVLINNTIRISVYSKRFIINTMKLVGARALFIRRPFLRRSLINSIIAALVALVLLGGAVWYVQSEIGDAMNLYQWHIILPVSVVVITFSFCITMLSTLFGVNRYLRMKTDDLYYI